MPRYGIAQKEKKQKKNTGNTMLKEIALENIGRGWHPLIEDAYDVSAAIGMHILAVYRKNGMLIIEYHIPADSYGEMHRGALIAMISVAYNIERLSAKQCELCESYGRRRKILHEVRCLCTEHYAIAYSEQESASQSATTV